MQADVSPLLRSNENGHALPPEEISLDNSIYNNEREPLLISSSDLHESSLKDHTTNNNFSPRKGLRIRWRFSYFVLRVRILVASLTRMVMRVIGLSQLSDSSTDTTSNLRAAMSCLGKYFWPPDNRQVKFRVVLSFILLLLANSFTVLVPLVFQQIIDNVSPRPVGSEEVSVTIVGAIPMSLLLSYMAARLGSSFCNELRSGMFARVTHEATRNVARDVFTHLHNLDLRYHLERQTGALTRTLDRGCRAVGFLMDSTLFSSIPSLIEILFVCAVLFFKYGAAFAVVTLFWVVVFSVFTIRVTVRRLKIKERLNEIDEEANARMIDSILNYETVKYFTKESHEVQKYDRLLEDSQELNIAAQKCLCVLNFGQQIVCSCALASLLIMSFRDIKRGKMSVGDMVAITGLLSQVYLPLEFMGWAWREFRQALIDIRGLVSILNLIPSSRERPQASELSVTGGCIEFDRVSFAFDPSRPILRNVTFTVPAGKTLAIVGPTGSGKSTILKLLFRFYEPTSGRIRIDGQDIAIVTLKSLREMIGVVPQDCSLMNSTIYTNIAYGCKDQCSQADILHAATLARVDDYVRRMPAQYQTLVGERGLKMSGGEKQRVGIARTVLKNSPILILDEATSALDSATERDIVEALRHIAEHRTTVVVAHRLSTIVHADEIIVLDGGVIIERGTHAKLVACQGGKYAEMWLRQSTKFVSSSASASSSSSSSSCFNTTTSTTNIINHNNNNNNLLPEIEIPLPNFTSTLNSTNKATLLTVKQLVRTNTGPPGPALKTETSPAGGFVTVRHAA